MLESHFVTSTGTEVGKTIVSWLLVNDLYREYDRVGYWKPVASDCDESPYGYRSPDEIEVIEETQLTPDDVHATFRFDAPLSPDKAAEREGRTINPDRVISGWSDLTESYEALVCEGIGGVAVPFTQNFDVTDLVAALKLPTIIVAPGDLGTISHTRTAENYLRNHSTFARAILLTPETGRSIETTNRNHLQEFFPDKTIRLVPDVHEDVAAANRVLRDYRNEVATR